MTDDVDALRKRLRDYADGLGATPVTLRAPDVDELVTLLSEADAEIEALRDRLDISEINERDYRRLSTEAEASIERLEKAGRRVTAAFRALGETAAWTRAAERARHECEAAMLALDAALEQEND